MATRADIEINVKGLKKVQELSKLLDKVSGKINQLNKGGGAASEKKNNKLERESLNLQEKKRASMVRVRSIGDQIARAKAQGLNVDKASRALNRAALANSKGKFKLAKASADAALLELKSLKAQTNELTQQKILRAAQGGGFGGGGFAGGLVGSAFGPMGGFAGGLVGTASVTIFQEQVLGLANALDPLNADIDLAIEKLKGLSRARKEEIKIIEEFRGKQAALEEITKDLTKIVGEDGVEAFRKLRESAKLFTDKFVDFALKLSSNAAKLVNNAKEFINPGGFDLAQAEAGLKSIDDPTLKDLNKKLEELRKELANLPKLNIAEATAASFLIQLPGAKKKVQDQREVKDRIENVKNQIKLTAAIKSGAIIEKEAGAELRNQQLRTREQLNLEQRINEIRTEGRFVISKGLAEEILALEKINNEKKKIFEKELKLAQATVNELQGRKDLSTEDQLRLDRANATVTSIEAQVKANQENFEVAKDLTIETRKLQNAANESVDAFERMATTIQNDIKNGIKGLIRGTSTLGDLLNNVADRFLDMGLNALLFGNVGGKTVTSGLFGLLGFANGGNPPVGKPSIVGEKGPELFVPKTSGTVIPNDKLGGGGTTNISVNVDASGSSVQGNEQQGKELGRLISVAIQSELLKQRRPGGLLR